MFAELIAAGALGFVKGLYGDKKRPTKRRSSFAGALIEETLFRGVLPPAVGLAGFVASHQPRTVGRIADLAVGSLLYGSAMKRFGLLGAVGAHVAHNVALGVGKWVSR